MSQNEPQLREAVKTDEQLAFAVRLWMELLNLGMEARLRGEGDARKLAVLDRLLACEHGSWHARPAVAAFPEEENGSKAPPLCVAGEEEGGTPHRIATRTRLREFGMHKAWTPLFEKLFARAGMSLNDPLNVIYLQEHASPHPDAYDQEIFERLQATLESCGDQETCAAVLRMALRRLAAELCTPDTALSSQVAW
jgi:hypothetical protein